MATAGPPFVKLSALLFGLLFTFIGHTLPCLVPASLIHVFDLLETKSKLSTPEIDVMEHARDWFHHSWPSISSMRSKLRLTISHKCLESKTSIWTLDELGTMKKRGQKFSTRNEKKKKSHSEERMERNETSPSDPTQSSVSRTPSTSRFLPLQASSVPRLIEKPSL